MYNYRLIRSQRKTLSLTVEANLSIVVRSPMEVNRSVIDQFVSDHESWIARQLQRQQERKARHPEPTEEQARAIRAAAEAILPQKVAHYARLMGLSPAGVTITGARKRFGSCSAKNRLCFSWRLMGYPEEAIDYVVVHELAHIRHKDHSAAFHACVAQILPDHIERRKLLRL